MGAFCNIADVTKVTIVQDNCSPSLRRQCFHKVRTSLGIQHCRSGSRGEEFFLMPRITKDDLEYCVKLNKCWDCYREEKDVQAFGRQRRRKLRVPCCRKHFEEMRQANALKYARHCERRQKAG